MHGRATRDGFLTRHGGILTAAVVALAASSAPAVVSAAMKIVKAQRAATGDTTLCVWLDTTRVKPDGVTPLPESVRCWTYGRAPAGVTAATWATQIRTETRLLAQLAAVEAGYAASPAPTTLPYEGQTP